MRKCYTFFFEIFILFIILAVENYKKNCIQISYFSCTKNAILKQKVIIIQLAHLSGPMSRQQRASMAIDAC